jgi:hypothetical protein
MLVSERDDSGAGGFVAPFKRADDSMRTAIWGEIYALVFYFEDFNDYVFKYYI